MKKKRILQFFGILLSAVLTAAAILPLETSSADHTRWMQNLPENALLNTLTIPGTHDSGALYSFAGVAGKCQSVPIDQQLKMGVRFLDIRLKLVNNQLNVVHSFADQKLTLKDALADMVSFIRDNPSEFLLVSFKEDDKPKKSDVLFASCLEEMFGEYEDVIAPDRSLPVSVGDARGKIFILARYDNASVGIPAYHGWQDSTSFALGDLYVQDHYELSDVSVKQEDIRKAAGIAREGQYAMVLNFTSCYLNHGFPPLSAAVPARKINPWLEEFIPSDASGCGIYICDFITSSLTAAMIERNFS